MKDYKTEGGNKNKNYIAEIVVIIVVPSECALNLRVDRFPLRPFREDREVRLTLAFPGLCYFICLVLIVVDSQKRVVILIAKLQK